MMKQLIMKSLMMVLVALCSLNAYAYDVEIDGIYYNLNVVDQTAKVTGGEKGYTNDVIIPSSIEDDGVMYAVTSVGDNAFQNNKELTSVVIPASVTYIGWSAFEGCSGLESVSISNGEKPIGHYGRDGTIIYPSAFENCTKLSSLNIGNRVVIIAYSAFKNCNELESLTIPENIISIGYDAFYGCNSLKEVTIFSSIISIEPSAFSKCEMLTDVYCYSVNTPHYTPDFDSYYIYEINNYNNYISHYISFHVPTINVDNKHATLHVPTIIKELYKENCSTFESVVAIDMEVDGIYYNLNPKNHTAEVTYSNYSGNIVIPNSIEYNGETYTVTSIIPLAFFDQNRLFSVTIPNSVTRIGEFAFWRCVSLTSVNIPNSVMSIGGEAFRDCRGLTSITIPNSVTFISTSAFADCRGLTSVNIPNSVTHIGEGAFYGCWGLTSVNIPNSVTHIGEGAFGGCLGLTSVDIPNSVTFIGNYAFAGCYLSSVTIPNSVTEIGAGTFYCSPLTDVYCYADRIPKTDPNESPFPFGFNYPEKQIVTLHVPSTLIDDYRSLSPWKYFSNIVRPSHVLTYIVDNVLYKTYEVEEMTEIIPEDIPAKEGYTFSGWGEIPATMPTEDLTVTGSFTINKYTLTYQIDGEMYKTYEIEYGANITAEEGPTKEGYTFSGWSEIPTAMPAKDVTITGSFTINKYTLTYKVDGEIYKSYDIEYGANITAEEEPYQKGCTFSGWSEIPATMPARDVTITGSFTVNSYTLTYQVDGEMYKTYEIEYGTNITAEEEPTKEGYTFSGWGEIPATMPPRDVTITGNFTLIDAIENFTADDSEYQIYTIDGTLVETLQKGVNIIKYKNGTSKKVVVK